MKKMYLRIAFYVADLDPSHGGIEKVTYLLSREFSLRGHTVYAIHINALPNDKNLYSHYEDLQQGDSTKLKDFSTILQFIIDKKIDLVYNQIFTCYSSVEL